MQRSVLHPDADPLVSLGDELHGGCGLDGGLGRTAAPHVETHGGRDPGEDEPGDQCPPLDTVLHRVLLQAAVDLSHGRVEL